MKNLFILLALIFFLSACGDSTTHTQDHNGNIHLLPYPKEITKKDKALVLSSESKIYAEDKSLLPLINIFQKELKNITSVEVGIVDTKNASSDLIFQLDESLEKDEYSIVVEDNVIMLAGSYQAAAMGRTTLLQLAFDAEGFIAFPKVNIKDKPDANYRGLMIDLARQWHTPESVRQLIDLASFYKTNYVQLHFTDYQSYTLPSKKYPKLATPDRNYSWDELREFEKYATERGVTIIPEIDIPGHSSSITKAYPELFGIKDIKDNPWIINMGKEEVYQAIETLIAETAEVFKSTPYFHIGGDEAIFNKVMDDPDVKNYIKAKGLEDDVHELYRHFLVRVNEMVKKHGKQMCVWEGFRKDGKVEIPKDIIVYEFETNRYLPADLVEDGYTVVNTSWKPLYVVNQKKWAPKTIYEWNMWHWGNWWKNAPSFITPFQIEKSPLVIGAQMCAWEQAEKTEFPSLRKRLPVMNERIWNTDEKIPFEDFIKYMEMTDAVLTKLVNDDRQDDLLHGHNFTAEMLEEK